MPAPAASPAAIARHLESVAREAGAALRSRFGGPRQVALKGEIDLVTDADQAAEALILERLTGLFPGCALLAEESGAQAAQAGAQGVRFIVDPLDGTTNFAQGLPHFSTTIACDDEAGLVAGVTYDPLRDELYLAWRGGGAWCNGQRLQVSRTGRLNDAVLATGFPYDVRQKGPEIFGFFETFIVRSRAVRRFGSAALDLAYVAQGRYDGYWERGLKPWDMAAGLLLVREAGGACTRYDGGEAGVLDGECVACPPALLGEMLAITRG